MPPSQPEREVVVCGFALYRKHRSIFPGATASRWRLPVCSWTRRRHAQSLRRSTRSVHAATHATSPRRVISQLRWRKRLNRCSRLFMKLMTVRSLRRPLRVGCCSLTTQLYRASYYDVRTKSAAPRACWPLLATLRPHPANAFMSVSSKRGSRTRTSHSRLAFTERRPRRSRQSVRVACAPGPVVRSTLAPRSARRWHTAHGRRHPPSLMIPWTSAACRSQARSSCALFWWTPLRRRPSHPSAIYERYHWLRIFLGRSMRHRTLGRRDRSRRRRRRLPPRPPPRSSRERS